MKWSMFGSKWMWKNKDYHLRRTKFIIYQLAMINMVVSESIGTAALTDYVKQQSTIEKLHTSATVHNDDFVGIASYNIFTGVAVATVFGAGFFFDLFFPERYEPKNIRWAWRLSAVFVTLCAFADALAFTVIVATGNAWISADSADAAQIALEKINPPLCTDTMAEPSPQPCSCGSDWLRPLRAASSSGFTIITLTPMDLSPRLLVCGTKSTRLF